MNATLFNHEQVASIERAITINRIEASDLVPAVMEGDEEAGTRMNQLNAAWIELERAKQEVTGIDPAPYRMRR